MAGASAAAAASGGATEVCTHTHTHGRRALLTFRAIANKIDDEENELPRKVTERPSARNTPHIIEDFTYYVRGEGIVLPVARVCVYVCINCEDTHAQLCLSTDGGAHNLL